MLPPHSLVGIVVALFLDSFGWICLGISRWVHPMLGEMLSSISDHGGTIFFTAWSIMGGGGAVSAKTIKGKGKEKDKGSNPVAQAKSKIWGKLIRFLVVNIVERFPIIGDMMPSWTFYVIREIRK